MFTRRSCVIAFASVFGLSLLGYQGIGLFSEAKPAVAADVDAKDFLIDAARQEIALAKLALKLITELEQQGQLGPYRTRLKSGLVDWLKPHRKAEQQKLKLLWR